MHNIDYVNIFSSVKHYWENIIAEVGLRTLLLKNLFITILLTLAPISELRGGIPFAIGHSISPVTAFILCVSVNALVGPLVFIFLETLHKLLYRIVFYKKIFDSIVKRARKRVQDKIDRYGYAGLTIFVAIPLPVTGAYTGAIGAWVLGMDYKKSFLAIAIGVVIAGLIVTSVTYFGIQALYFFTK